MAATYTPYYHLKKPASGDNYNIGDFNGNMDILDPILKAIADDLTSLIENGVPASGNETASTIQTALEVFDIRRHNPTGDGVADDYSAVGSSLDDVISATGGIVQLGNAVYAMNTQVNRPYLGNTIIRGDGKSEIKKKSGTPSRLLYIGTSDQFPASDTVPASENILIEHVKFTGLGTILGNDPSVINNSGNVTQFLKPFNVRVMNCVFKDIDNAALRFNLSSEGDLFNDMVLTPTLITDSSFSVVGDQVSLFTVGNVYGVFNAVPESAIGNLKGAGRVLTAVYDEGTNKTVITLELTKGTVQSGITHTGALRNEQAFKGYYEVAHNLFTNVRQIITNNDTGCQFGFVHHNYFKECGSIKNTTKVLGNDYHFHDRNVYDKCGERIYSQGAGKVFVWGNVFTKGIGNNATAYGAYMFSYNDEATIKEDKSVFVIENNFCEGDYQGVYFFGSVNTNYVIDTIIVRNNVFKNIAHVRSDTGGGLINLQGRFKKVIIECNHMNGIGVDVPLIKVYPRCDGTDSYVEEVEIRNNNSDGGKEIIYLTYNGYTRKATDIYVHDNTFLNAKGLRLDGVKKLRWERNKVDFKPYTVDGDIYIKGEDMVFEDCYFNVQAGSTVAVNILQPQSGSKDIKCKNVILRSTDSIIGGLVCSATNVKVEVENCDFKTGSTAFQVSGYGCIGYAYRNKFYATSRASGKYDMYIANTISAFKLKDNETYGNVTNIYVDTTMVRNFKKVSWNPASIADLSSLSTTFTVPDAKEGDLIIISPHAHGSPLDMKGTFATAHISTSGIWDSIYSIAPAVLSFSITVVDINTFTVTETGVSHVNDFPVGSFVYFMTTGAVMATGYVSVRTYDGTSVTTVDIIVASGDISDTDEVIRDDVPTFKVIETGVDHGADFPIGAYIEFWDVSNERVARGYVNASAYDAIDTTTVSITIEEGSLVNATQFRIWINGIVTVCIANLTGSAQDLGVVGFNLQVVEGQTA